MTRRSLVRAALAGIVAALSFWPNSASAAGQDMVAVREFQQAIDGYMALRQGLAAGLKGPEISRELGKIQRDVATLADELRRARAGARRGDIFTADVSDVIRRQIRVTLRQSGYVQADLLRALIAESTGADQPVVNGRFAWATATPMLPCLLLALPELPDALQYRFVGGDLVLVDTDASLILDVLPDVLAPTLSS